MKSGPDVQQVARPDPVMGRRLGERAVHGVRACSVVPDVPAHEMTEHTHGEAHFIFVTRGRYASSADGAGGASGGTLIFNPPGTVHRDCFAADEDLRAAHFYALWFSPAAWNTMAGSLDLPGWSCAVDADALDVPRQMESLFDSEMLATIDLECVAAEWIGQASKHFDRDARFAPSWLMRVRQQLRDTIDKPADLAQLASDHGVHPVYLARTFRRHFHMSPGEYARRCRLDRAAALLANPRVSLADVAHDCGYHDQAHFSRMFTRAYGLAPARYRQALLT